MHLCDIVERLLGFWGHADSVAWPGPGWFSFDAMLPGNPADSIGHPCYPVDPLLRYASPEYTARMTHIGRRRGTEADDIFGFGVHAFILLTGRDPFLRGGSWIEGITTRMTGPYPDIRKEARKDIPHALIDLVANCLTVNPEDRCRSLQGIRETLRAVHRSLI